MKNKIRKKYFIYNTVTGNCLSRINYYNTIDGKEKLNRDLEMLEKMLPAINIGEIFFEGDTFLYTVPKGIKNVRRK